jgi:hypothetical protein
MSKIKITRKTTIHRIIMEMSTVNSLLVIDCHFSIECINNPVGSGAPSFADVITRFSCPYTWINREVDKALVKQRALPPNG